MAELDRFGPYAEGDMLHAYARRAAAYVLQRAQMPTSVEAVSRSYIFPERYRLAPVDRRRSRSDEVILIIKSLTEPKLRDLALTLLVGVDLELVEDDVVSYGVEFTLVPDWQEP